MTPHGVAFTQALTLLLTSGAAYLSYKAHERADKNQAEIEQHLAAHEEERRN